MSSSSYECQNEIQSALNLYWGFVAFSLGLTVLNLAAFRICMRRRLENHPKLAAKIFFSMGAIKIILGILILSVFQPSCPSGCVCYGYLPSPLYGCIVLIIGALWMLRGYKYLNVSREVVDYDHEEQPIASPTSEIETFSKIVTSTTSGGEKEKDAANSSTEVV